MVKNLNPEIPMKAILITLSAMALLAFYCTGEEPAKTPAAPTTAIPLDYVDVNTVHEILRSAIPEIDTVVASVHVDTNSLTLNTAATQYVKVRELLAKLDKQPQQIMIEMEIIQVDAAGKETIVSRPKIHSLAGEAAEVSFGTLDGKQMKLSIKATPVPEDEQEALKKK
jgi:hypothetical protein